MNQILLGDCQHVLRQSVPDNSVDLIVTSPPYAEARRHTYGGVKAKDYVRWFMPKAEEFKRVLKPTGSFVLNIKENVVDGERLTYVLNLVIHLMDDGWRWADEFVWHKPNPVPGDWPNRLKDGWEHLYHFTKEKQYKFYPEAVSAPSTSKWKDDGKRRKNQGPHISTSGSRFNLSRRFTGDLVRPSNVIVSPVESRNKIRHSAVFPEALPEFFVKLMTLPGDVVLDPFVGSGTSALVAKRLGRQYVGIDILPENVAIAQARISGTKAVA